LQSRTKSKKIEARDAIAIAGFLFFAGKDRRTKMSNSNSSPQGISLDVYAVTLALILALLVRLNLIPFVRW
jgi:hypothetical protein